MATGAGRGRRLDRFLGVAFALGLVALVVIGVQWSRTRQGTVDQQRAATGSEFAQRLDRMAVTGLHLVPELRDDEDSWDDILEDLDDESELVLDTQADRDPVGADEATIAAATEELLALSEGASGESVPYAVVLPTVTTLFDEAQLVLEGVPLADADRLAEARPLAVDELLRLAGALVGADGSPASPDYETMLVELRAHDERFFEEPEVLDEVAGPEPTFEDFDRVSEVVVGIDNAAFDPEADDSAPAGGWSSPFALASALTLVLGVTAVWRWTLARTRRKIIEDSLRHDATHDPLTGLLNRKGLDADFAEMRRRTGQVIAIVYIDLDGFKQVNDRFGHHAGDELLRQVARRLVGLVRGEDRAVRLGGDEFVVVLHGVVGLDDAVGVGRRIVDALSARYTVDEDGIDVGASAGVAISRDPADSLAGLMRDADAALYVAKRQDDDNVVATPAASL